jgi:small subunit ribosomal protein S1
MEDFAAALAAFETEKEKEQAALEDNRILKGTVVDITPTHAIVHVGTKSDGMVPVAELKDHEGNLKFKPGDEIDVMIDRGEHDEGYISLSHQKAQRLRAWDDIEKAHNENTNIRAKVVERVKGGLSVDINGARAFLPGSQADVRPVRNLESLLGQEFDVRIVKLNKKRGNIVVCTKAPYSPAR